jgi:hypothetical protein
MIKYSLRGYIKRVMLEEKSSGCKFTELMVDVLVAWYEGHISYDTAPTPEIILQIAKKDFRVLRYEHKIGNMVREKIFVYNKEK